MANKELEVLDLGALNRESLSDGIIRVLRGAILGGELKPGSRLVESDTAERLGVSRAPLREALRALAEQGLVEMSPHRGTYVTMLSAEDAEEIYSLRSVLEAFAVKLASRYIGEEEIGQLQNCLNEMHERAAEGDRAGVVDKDLRLHTVLWQLSRHRRLIRTLMEMRSQVEMLVAVNTKLYEDLVQGIEDHQPIIDALRAGDWQLAARLLEDHILSSGDLVVQSLRESEESS